MHQPSDASDLPTNDASGEGSNRSSVAPILAFFGLAVIALAAIQFFWQQRNPGMNATGVGHRLPDLRLEPLTGAARPVRLNDLAGKVVLLDFWGTWCPPCRAEFPHIAELAVQYRDRPDFQVLAVSCGAQDDDLQTLRPNTATFLQDRQLEISTYFDPQSYTREQIEKVAGFEGYPTSLLLDRSSVIRGIWVGYEPGTETQIAALAAKLLNEIPRK